jgi:hypothetical protein
MENLNVGNCSLLEAKKSEFAHAAPPCDSVPIRCTGSDVATVAGVHSAVDVRVDSNWKELWRTSHPQKTVTRCKALDDTSFHGL